MLDAGSIPLDSIPLPVLPTGTHPQQQAFPGMELEQHPQLMLNPAHPPEYPTGPTELPLPATMGHTYEGHSIGADSYERLEQQEQEREQLLMADWQHHQQLFLQDQQLQQHQQQQQVAAEPDAMDSQTSGQGQQDQQQVQGTPHTQQAVPIRSAEDAAAAAAAAAEAAMAAAAAAAAVAAVNEGHVLPVEAQPTAGVGAVINPAANVPAEIEVYCGAVHGVFNTRRWASSTVLEYPARQIAVVIYSTPAL